MIPKASNFPNSFDSDTNLFLVHDSLRVRLLEDYNPGDTSILIEGDEDVISKFPPTGIITLTEQCSEIDKRALSFYYNSKTSSSFDELELLPEFKELIIAKPKKLTNVTMNVLDKHHNHLKDALISVEYFLGTKFDTEKTLTGRIKHLEKIVFTPKAWFSVSTQIGLAPLKVEFSNQSLRLGEGWIREVWDFGEKDAEPITINSANSKEYIIKQGTINGVEYSGTVLKKTYHTPGIYDVKLTMTNEQGENTVEFKQVIVVRNECPEPAIIRFVPKPSQKYINSNPPRLRSAANNFVSLEIPEGENPEKPGYSYSGELLDELKRPIDRIREYSWYLNDDLPHANSSETKASYSLGGYYDVNLRVDTEFGSYRITGYSQSVDIIESKNLWLFNYKNNKNEDSSGLVQCYEFGLNSETFKTVGTHQTVEINRSSSFLNKNPYSYGSNDYYKGTLEKAKKEFERNTEFVSSGTAGSGDRGDALLLWASGGSDTDEKNIHIRKYNGFDDTYENLTSISNRPWNWVALSSLSKIYFLFGQDTNIYANSNQAFSQRLDYDLTLEMPSDPVLLSSANFENGADELLNHPSYFDEDGLSTGGYFATYRSAWKDSTGYILRNSSVNEFFRLGSFYKTKGSISNPFVTLTKLPDLVGSIKLEGQLVALYNGIFMFNNSGEICAWNDTSLTWEVGRANSSSLSFRSVQDTSKSNFEDKSNTLLAASDADRVAYLSYDYSDKTFIKFNATDLTFSTTKFRPPGDQFKMGVY